MENDMPADIRSAALRVYTMYIHDRGNWSLVDLIAEALMAERTTHAASMARKAKQKGDDK